MKCDHNCFNCKYSDCIENEITVAEMREQREYDKKLAREEELTSANLDYRRRWELQNYERARENKRRWYQQNKERMRAKNKKYYEENKEQIKEQHKKYIEENRELYNAMSRENNRKYRAAAKAAAKATT